MGLLFERILAHHCTDVNKLSSDWDAHVTSGIETPTIHSYHTQPDVELPNPTQKIIIGSTSALSCLRPWAGWAEDTHIV